MAPTYLIAGCIYVGVNSLAVGARARAKSLAILEYLEEKYPEPPLLPADPQARAWVRG